MNVSKTSQDKKLPASSVTNFFVFISALFLSIAVVLSVFLYRADSGKTTLSNLSADERLQLLEQAQSIAPAVYQPFPTHSPSLFYRMKPNTNYVNVLGDNFKTNELGFRTISTLSRPENTKRVLVIGDSWTYGPYVSEAQTFPSVLSKHLNTGKQKWQVYNLSMLGWNTDNQVAALWNFIGQIKPDLVVICPTSNDIDESFDVWNGRLVSKGFNSRAIFRYSYEYENRWFKVFGQLQRTVDALEAKNIPVLIYFLAEWRKLAPYYAHKTGFNANYTVVPTNYIHDRYRLSSSIDPGRHPSPEGYRLIGEYLYNSLIDADYIKDMERLPITTSTLFPKRNFDEQTVRAEFGFWYQFANQYDLIALHKDTMGKKGLFSVPNNTTHSLVEVKLKLIDDWTLYPLKVKLRIASDDGKAKKITFNHYATDIKILLDIPHSVKKYPFIEVHVETNRSILPNERNFPVSMYRPDILMLPSKD